MSLTRRPKPALACMTCNKTNTRPHCRPDHPSCNWIVCRVCGSYGDPMRADRWRATR